MHARLSKSAVIIVALCLAALTLAALRAGPAEGVGSITVKLPPAQSTPRPGFKF